MDYNPTEYSTLVLIDLLFASAAANPQAHGQGVLLRSLTVGNCPGGQPILGVTVSIIGNILDGRSAVVGSGTTDANGKFRISFQGPILNAFPQITIPFVPIINSIFHELPSPLCRSAGCPMLNTTGILVSPVQIGPLGTTSSLGFVNLGMT